MKLTMTMALAAGMAWAGGTVPARTVTVCSASVSDFGTLQFAKGQASRMFATAGVKIEWRERYACPAGAILVSLSQRTSPADHPGALAYALPYEGTHIVVFYDRMKAKETGNPTFLPVLLAHVLVHEITHVLQGVSRHSVAGIMKAQWNDGDLCQMRTKPLLFTALDIDLIQLGVDGRSRNGALEAANLTRTAAQ